MKITINMVIDDHYLAVHAQDDNSEHVDNDDDMKNWCWAEELKAVLTRRIPSNQKAEVSTIFSDSSLQFPHSGILLRGETVQEKIKYNI